MLGLRMSEGVDLVEMGRRFGLDLLTEYAGKFTDLAEAGLVEFFEGRVKLTPGGFLLGNLVFAECVECGTGAQP
jgi:coproporphyrinogen III oxidase-like Fe-S oxidoreductase